MDPANLRPTLPPRQQLAAAGKWPVVGERAPRKTDAPWQFSILGCVARPITFSLDELQALPQVERTVDIHCVTRWSKLGVKFRGVLARDLIAAAQPTEDARFVSFVARSERAHDTSLPWSYCLQHDVLAVWQADGKPLEEIHGGPVRIVAPGRYFYKSLKWLERIELLRDDRLGYWERTAGYHNGADPECEERYVAAGISRAEAEFILAAKDIAGRELLGLCVTGTDLRGLNARNAVLRNADFRRCQLQGACFEGANLTNARFDEADLQGASFACADVEGADFRRANLIGCGFSGASLLAASFSPGSEFAASNQIARD